jgi:hypothetical protein
LLELYNTNRYKIRLAQEEHSILGRTIRERLIQSIVEKKKRLMREKEHLDVADSNALLLHPSQFSITNPSSPGGISSNRKTRHTRHRPGENDDVSGTDGHKRKRKALDDDVGSPGPSGRILETGTSSPFRDARAKLASAQFDTPLYSVDKLFTEKELGLSLNLAATAATSFFATESTQSKTQEEAPAPTDEPLEDAPTAPELDRIANMSHHATRSSKKDGSSALNLLGDLAISEKNGGFPNAMILPASVITKTGQAPTPPPLSPEDAQEDILKMDRLAATAPGTADPQLMTDLVSRSANRDLGDSIITKTAASAIPMSAQSSLAGFSELGGYAMKRDEGSSLGSAMMKRTASGAGFSATSDAGKRIRNR